MIVLFREAKKVTAVPFSADIGADVAPAVSVPIFQPVVIIDYTRSDEQWTAKEIMQNVKAAQPKSSFATLPPKIFSLDYSMSYTHTGITYGDSLKTTFTATIKNAPMELVGLLNIQQYTSQQNITALGKALNNVIDPQVQFPSGKFFIRQSKGKDPVSRPFIVYSTPFNFDSRRLNSTLTLRGASFDSMVMRLKFSINLEKDKPLLSQLVTALSSTDYGVVSFGLSSAFPKVSKYYAPAPLEDIVGEICQDNNLAFDIIDNKMFFQSLSPKSAPLAKIIHKFSFGNYVSGTKLISTFSLNNYASCEFDAEICEMKLYSSVAVYDDSQSTGLFSNLTKMPPAGLSVGTVPSVPGLSKISGYRFYIQGYTYNDSREKTSVTVRGSNNWLVSNFKLDTLLENAIYKNELTNPL